MALCCRAHLQRPPDQQGLNRLVWGRQRDDAEPRRYRTALEAPERYWTRDDALHVRYPHRDAARFDWLRFAEVYLFQWGTGLHDWDETAALEPVALPSDEVLVCAWPRKVEIEADHAFLEKCRQWQAQRGKPKPRAVGRPARPKPVPPPVWIPPPSVRRSPVAPPVDWWGYVFKPVEVSYRPPPVSMYEPSPAVVSAQRVLMTQQQVMARVHSLEQQIEMIKAARGVFGAYEGP